MTIDSADSMAASAIHQVTSCCYFGFHPSPPLAIRCMFGGEARYWLGGNRELVVDDASYLVCNHGQDYRVEKDSAKPVETFCVSLPSALVHSVWRGARESDERLLDEPEAGAMGLPRFFEHRRPHGGPITRRLERMRRASDRGGVAGEGGAGEGVAGGELEEQLFALARDLIGEEQRLYDRVQQLPMARASTRRELYARVHRGRDFLHAHLSDPVTVADAARAVCLSPFHFLRAFHQVFRLTPGAYLTRARIERASALLASTALSVTQVALCVGFCSVPSFNRAFRSQVELTPTAYRKIHRSAAGPRRRAPSGRRP